MNYSQNNEQEVIVKHFAGRRGRFLDIGAYDGKKFSNTYRLLELGWSGVMVEPSPSTIESLRRNIEPFNSKVIVMQCAITDADGPIDFYDDGGGAVATTSIEHVRKWEKAAKFTQCKVEGMTPRTLLDEVGTDFDFINIDVESANLDVLHAIPFHRLPGLSLICIEHDREQKRIMELLDGFEFRKLHENAENLILCR